MFGLSDCVVNDLNRVFERFPEIKEVRLFGSRAMGSYTNGSDIDLAVVGDELKPNTLLKIMLDIDDLELLYKVDVVSYRDHVDTSLGDHIDRVFKVFYTKEN